MTDPVVPEEALSAAWRRIDQIVSGWMRIHLDLARAATGDMNAEERAKQQCLDHIQYLALSGFSSQLTPQIIDEFVALGWTPPEPDLMSELVRISQGPHPNETT